MENLSFEDQVQVYGGATASEAGYWTGYWIGACTANIRNGVYLLKDIIIDVSGVIGNLK